RQAATEYNRLEVLRSELQATMAAIFVAFALLLLFAAISVGLAMANRLARPISRLIVAAEQVRAGDLGARVVPAGDEPELGSLMRSFNRMTEQLSQQHRELIDANKKLEDRRRFTETVLAGVSAGVLGLDAEGRVTLPNRSAAKLLGLGREGLAGRPLAEVVPEMAGLLATARQRPERRLEDQVTLHRDGEARTLLVRIAAERGEDGAAPGYVVTFDDITELETAQRTAAWADVARRIAHEIRNPLTPIQLSAERLKRKYAGEVTSDRAVFEQYTDTIVRQVGDIRRMVDEFSAFARMPQPEPTLVDLRTLVCDGMFVQRTAHPGVAFELRMPETALMCRCDSRLVGQAITNLLQNAVEAIEGREGDVPPGEVTLSLVTEGEWIVLAIEDNGRGLPVAERARLAEPYVTTRAKGTGLGLAIVKKIAEDHGGRLLLEDRGAGAATVAGAAGARVVLVFPVPTTGERLAAAETRPAAE
ncbi:MAG: PAS domain-containing protein, partial [Alphaproteobacteria bacterium]|nr:PAS domain-containing protein [Alphaproteobacteria bacterium]